MAAASVGLAVAKTQAQAAEAAKAAEASKRMRRASSVPSTPTRSSRPPSEAFTKKFKVGRWLGPLTRGCSCRNHQRDVTPPLFKPRLPRLSPSAHRSTLPDAPVTAESEQPQQSEEIRRQVPGRRWRWWWRVRRWIRRERPSRLWCIRWSWRAGSRWWGRRARQHRIHVQCALKRVYWQPRRVARAHALGLRGGRRRGSGRARARAGAGAHPSNPGCALRRRGRWWWAWPGARAGAGGGAGARARGWAGGWAGAGARARAGPGARARAGAGARARAGARAGAAWRRWRWRWPPTPTQ